MFMLFCGFFLAIYCRTFNNFQNSLFGNHFLFIMSISSSILDQNLPLLMKWTKALAEYFKCFFDLNEWSGSIVEKTIDRAILDFF